MKRKPHSRRKRTSTKSVLRLPDLEHAKTAVLDGQRIYTANNERGSVSVLDVRARTLVATIPISKKVQRISISPDGKFIFTQDQQTPRIVVIDTATNAVVRSMSLPRIPFSSAITKDGHWLLANSESGKLFVVEYGVVGPCKSKSSQKPVPVYPPILRTLGEWKQVCRYNKPDDWVFATDGTVAASRFGAKRSRAHTFARRRTVVYPAV
jgi:YVTN family beta-propeller protein